MKKRSSAIENGPETLWSQCLWCGAPLYRLGDGRVKCSACARRYAPAKIGRRLCLAEAFCRDESARGAAKGCGCSVLTAQKGYAEFRRVLLPWLEARYKAHRHQVREYDEALYLPAAKRRKRGAIFDAHNYLIFDYGAGVYTLLMPSLSRYKEQFLADGMEELYAREFARFLRRHRVARLESIDNTLDRFRFFVEAQLRRYRGIPPEQFVDYLKEAEFKFNLPDPSRRYEVLRTLLLGA